MKDDKRLVQMASRVADAVAKLKYDRHAELARRLANLVSNLDQISRESRKMSIALSRHWLAAADRCRTCVCIRLCELSYSISKVQKLTEAPRKKTAMLSVIAGELKQLRDEFGDL